MLVFFVAYMNKFRSSLKSKALTVKFGKAYEQ